MHILCFYPNIVDHFRLIFISLAFYYFQNPIVFITLYALSYILDLFDGVVARACHQVTAFGQIYDVICDRSCTATMLIMLSHLHPNWKGYFIFIMLFDLFAHWYIFNSTLLVKESSHKASHGIPILWLYYDVPYMLCTTVVFSEVHQLVCYYIGMNSAITKNVYFMALFWVSWVIFAFKQLTNVSHILLALKRFVDLEEDSKKKTNIT